MVEMLECACAPTHLYARESSERRLTAAAERAVNAGFVWSVLTRLTFDQPGSEGVPHIHFAIMHHQGGLAAGRTLREDVR